MKAFKTILSFILSLFLMLSLFLTTVLFSLPGVLQKDSLIKIIDGSDVGKQILAYEYPKEESQTIDFFEALNQAIPVQGSSMMNIFGDKAKICQDGAIEYIKKRGFLSHAYTDLKELADGLSRGYVSKAVEEGYIDPDRSVTYMTQIGRVSEPQEDFLRSSTLDKYQKSVEELQEDGFFSALDIDQKQPFAYILYKGKQAETIQNGLYEKIEGLCDEILSQQYSSLIDALTGKQNEFKGLNEKDFSSKMLQLIKTYLADQGIDELYLDTEKVESIIRTSIHEQIYPKLYPNLPSYDNTISQLTDSGTKLLGMLNNNTLMYFGIGLSIVFALLLMWISKKDAFFYIGMGALLSGAFVFSTKFGTSGLIMRATSAFKDRFTGISLFLPKLIETFIAAFSQTGIYLIAAGLIFIIVSFFLSRSGKKDA